MLGLAGESLNLKEYNLEKMKELFPEVFEEGKIDFDKLRLILGDEVEDNEERYEFTWHGKNNAIRIAQTPSTGTLIPDKESSKNWDDTENIYIEGDNLEVLKLLQKSYFGKVKMIYIDPPYNTGDDFVYHDNFRDNIANYKEITNQSTRANPETNGRYHTDWLNMMYPRLKLARNLLSEDGVIFISIDDNEVENLKKIANEIMGEENFICQLVWEKKKKGAFLNKHFINIKEYILVFAKSSSIFAGLFGEINERSETYPCIKTTNARGIRTIKSGTISKYKDKDYTLPPNTRISSGNMELIYLDELVIKNGYIEKDVRIDSNWIYTQESLDKFSKEGLLYITQDLYVRRVVEDDRIKKLKDLLLRVGVNNISSSQYIYNNNLNENGWGTNEDANLELHNIFGIQYLFDFSKPSKLISKLIQSLYGEKDIIILDFFSGSSTTAHATIQLNCMDNGKRKFIMVQLPEKTKEDTEAYKAGYKNICEIGKERIRRAGDKIVSENKDKEGIENLDIGFKVFKLDSSNLKSWDSSIDNLEQNLLDMESNLKKDRTNEDLLYEILLKSGVELTAKIEEIKVGYNTLYNIGQGALLACLDDKITQDVIDEIPKHRSPFMDTKVIFKEAGFMSDAAKINAVQNLKQFKIEDVRSV
ncbi:site-specific DNA-methyltransferase [Intestinibacter bartlettii]|uniref:Site-specific DNA-methyltransferase n=1 Tax=Intestinibacter bartlettii TaxID=261299 RepID=A0ABS6DUG5_9FIRM|nr:site-specific DNA-methyltransferase [Intestinibacter bartlettii]MBU5335456.1 site-specific DNA-methyltransferase [Intestinibacter bartlettii]